MMYVVAFGIDGYEAMFAVDHYKDESEQHLYDILKDPNTPKPSDELGEMLRSMSLRFRFNSQRRIEVYTIHLSDEQAKQVEVLMIDNEETVKEFIRKYGRELVL